MDNKLKNDCDPKPIRTIEELNEIGLIDSREISDLIKVAEHFSIALSPQILTQLTKQPHAAIARQFIPTVDELLFDPDELNDPIGDSPHTVIKGLIHRYPDRVLLKPVNVCPVYCRFCFRREKVGPGNEALSNEDLTKAYHYIQGDKNIWEVILSGGDPLVLKPKKLAKVLQALAAIEHVAVIRIHTRVPSVDPESISAEMISALKVNKALYVVLHANHAAEFTDKVKSACARLVDAGIPLLSQSVLMKGINDDVKSLSELMRTFVSNRIKPYYLHQCDLAKGTGHFRVPIKKGLELMQSLRGNFSGLCQPTYVIDIPGGFGKVPIMHNYLSANLPSEKLYTQDDYQIEDYQGNLHAYKVSFKE